MYGPGVSQERTRQLLRPTQGKFDPFGEALQRRVDDVFERDRVVEYFLTVGKGAKLGDRAFKNYMEVVLPHNLHAHLYYIIEAAYLVGLSNSPLFRRMLEAFETGGIPCGWIGQSYEDDGDPYESVALLHFGRQSTG